jgi:Arylsulfotransferase (ASST)
LGENVTTIHPRARFVALLAITGAVATGATGAATASAADTSPFQSFHSRPDLHPPKITIGKRASGTAPGYIFTAPRPIPDGPQQGPLILDSSGHVVWFHPVKKGLTSVDFQAQRYKGKPVLTWSERPVINGTQIFEGAADQQFDVIFNSKYKEIRRLQATGAGVHTQIHEFLLTKRNAVVVGYRFLTLDASKEGGSTKQTVIDAVVQVVSLKTNRVVFNWHSIAHVPLSSSVLKADPKLAYDYFHLNSVSLTRDHNLLISARHTNAAYKVSLKTGKVIWTLGGKHSDFKLSPDAQFYYQHDVVDRGKGVYTMFDNHLSDFDQTHGTQSRGLVLQLRLKKRGANTASLKRQYLVPGRVSGSQGNFEQLPNGNVFIGWGISPFASEFSAAGKLLYDFSMPSGSLQSYRTFRYRFSGSPDTQPALVASRKDGEVTAFASWNGTTTTRSWALMAGSRKGHLGKVASGPKRNFEVKLKARTNAPLVRVLALDGKGKVIGSSPMVRPKKG